MLLGGHKPLSYSLIFIFSLFWGHPSNGAVFQSSCPISAGVAHRHPDGTLLFSKICGASVLGAAFIRALDFSRLSLPPGGAYLSCGMPMGCLVFDLFYAPTGTYLVTYCRYRCLSFS